MMLSQVESIRFEADIRANRTLHLTGATGSQPEISKTFVGINVSKFDLAGTQAR